MLCIILFQHIEGNAQTYFNNLEGPKIPTYWVGQQTIDTGKAYSGQFMSIADSLNPYGLGIEMQFPDEKKGKNVLVYINGWVKSNDATPKAVYVITAIDKGKEVFWEGIRLDSIIGKANTWYKFNRAFKFPASVTKDAIFKCFLWNIDLKTVVAVDDLKIQFEEMITPTFLPKFDQWNGKLNPITGIDKILYANLFYMIAMNGHAPTFLSKDFEPIASLPLAYSHLIIDGKEVIMTNDFIFQNSKTRKGITSLNFIASDKYTVKKLQIICNDLSPELRFEISEKFRKKSLCKRSSILLRSHQAITEVMRANRKSDINDFQKEYWLDKQGARFGSDKNSLVIYHSPGLSSMQLDTENTILWLNMDFIKDHPFLHFPLRDDTIDYKLDWSESIYKRGSKRENQFSMYLGTGANTLPRLMKNPSGYVATYIWTEHADYSNIRTNRATYFGSENIQLAENAEGGFLYYKIPVTKSVFYNNPDQITNAEISGGAFTGMESAILTDTAFHGFLKQIEQLGIEICLHTPDQFTTTKNDLVEALNYTQQNFGSKTWIDHGYNNLLKNNREDFMCDGLLKKSPYYAAESWEKYGVQYFWNAYYEDFFTFEKWRFGSFLESYYCGFGDFMPKPDYWLHPTRSAGFIHWPTSTVLYIENNDLWNYFFNDQNLETFVNNWSVEVNHCYPAWVDPRKGFWTYDIDSTIIAQPGFNTTLEKMSDLNIEGQLNVTTIEEFLDYQIVLENIDYKILPDGRVVVTNNNSQDIKGLSFATKAKAVLVDRLKPAQKRSGDDLIFWFDIVSKASRVIRFAD